MKLKCIPEDFVVQEVLITRYSKTDNNENYLYFQLDKKGYSSFDAGYEIETFFGLQKNSISMAGLKDSDGVTRQMMCIDRSINEKNLLESIQNRLEEFHKAYGKKDSFIYLTFQGFSSEKIVAGKLEGNAFKLVLRDLDEKAAEKLLDLKHEQLFYPNYFDKQRFGMPNHKKVTHLVGKAINEGDYKTAYEYIKQSGAREATLPFNGDYKAFIESINERTRNFYQSAVLSVNFNNELASLVQKNGDYVEVEDEGLVFSMPATQELARNMLYSKKHEEMFLKSDNVEGKRRIINAIEISFLAKEDDKFHPGKAALTVSFFLPYGAYATMCMKQLQVLADSL